MMWQTIENAPTDERVDLWAKRWDAKSDTFEFQRFVDCRWRSTHWMNLPQGWRATHWMPAPMPPREMKEAA